MPDYALEHVFSRYGAVDFVRLQSNACYGVVQFATAEAAAAALAGLAGTDILGQVCSCKPCQSQHCGVFATATSAPERLCN